MTHPISKPDGLDTWQPVRRQRASRKPKPFAHDEIKRKNATGSWLSPIEQPEVKAGIVPVPKSPPQDKHYRSYMGAVAVNLPELVEENRSYFREEVSDSFRAYPLISKNSVARHPDRDLLNRSLYDCPVSIPYSVYPETALFSLQREANGTARSSSLKFSWLERGYIVEGRFKHSTVFNVQVRHHTKLESFHEIRRPVYCINFRSDINEPFDMRLIGLLHTEMPFLEAAARSFARKNDAFNGLPVLDHQGRVLLDDRVVRRAAYHYAHFQRELLREELYSVGRLANHILSHAHFIVLRSHLPELSFDTERQSFAFKISSHDWLGEDRSSSSDSDAEVK